MIEHDESHESNSLMHSIRRSTRHLNDKNSPSEFRSLIAFYALLYDCHILMLSLSINPTPNMKPSFHDPTHVLWYVTNSQ